MVVVDYEEFRRLPAELAVWRSGLALARGDIAETMRYADQAHDLVSENDHLLRGSAAGLLGLAYWATGNLETAHRRFAECVASLKRAGYRSDALGGTIALADMRIAQGRLRDARRTYAEALQLAEEADEPVLRGTADMYVGLSGLHREWNELEAATQLLLRSKELGELAGMPQNAYRWCVAMARVRETQGDLDAALDLRHAAATLMLAAGVHPKVASERLGHSNISITMDYYTHAVPSLEAEAARRLEALLAGPSPAPQPIGTQIGTEAGGEGLVALAKG
jgi:LuxR family maltose regulon positive regulatory protein